MSGHAAAEVYGLLERSSLEKFLAEMRNGEPENWSPNKSCFLPEFASLSASSAGASWKPAFPII